MKEPAMNDPNKIEVSGIIVIAQNGRLFIESPEHYYAVANDRLQLQPSDSVQFEAVYDDQFANVTTVNERRLS